MRRILFILLSAFYLAAFVLDAQETGDLTNAQRRRINSSVLDIIERYEQAAALSDEDSKYEFRNLFVSDSSRVYLDIMGVRDYMSEVSVKSYMDIMEATTYRIGTSIYDVSKGGLTLSGSLWKIPVKYHKDVMFFDKNGIAFSSNDFYAGEKFSLTMNLVYDPVEDICKIASINGSLDSDNEFPQVRYYVIKQDDNMSPSSKKKEEKLLAFNNLQYDDYGQVFVNPAQLKPWHGDIRIKPSEKVSADNYAIPSFKFKRLKWRAKARYAQTIGQGSEVMPGAFSIESDDSDIKQKSSAYEYGVDIGRAALVGKNGALGIYTGIAIATTKLDLSYKNTYKDKISYSIPVYEGANKNRAYTDLSFDESLTYTDFVIPLYVSIEHKVFKFMQWNWTLGARMYLNKSVSGGELSATGYFDGGNRVTKYFNSFVAPTKYCEPMSFSAMAGLSININLVRNWAYVYAKAGYEYGINKYHESDAPHFFNADNSVYPLVYSPQHKDVAVRSMLGCTTLRRKALWVEGGFYFKF